MIRERVVRGIALNRVPGLHFAGNFLDLSFDTVSREAARTSFVPGPHCDVALRAGGRQAGFGSGAFMVLKPPPGMTLHPVRHRGEAPPLQESDLERAERPILLEAVTTHALRKS
jgi:hypothetical protein